MGSATRKQETQGCDTVIILGAGFSYEAGIPLMSGFVDRMWELAVRKTYKGKALDASDVDIFAAADRIRNELNEYHGRAAFNDRNIEDILSILSFNAYAPQRSRPNPISVISKAIGRTIELSCTVTHPGVHPLGRGGFREDGPHTYREFWKSLIKLHSAGTTMPALITFNYDLVLERAFLQTLIGLHFNERRESRSPFRYFRINHHYETVPNLTYELGYLNYPNEDRVMPGSTLKPYTGAEPASGLLEVDLLKLHGSLNFPAPRSQFDPKEFNVAKALDVPFIQPPIFNKQSIEQQQAMWRAALLRLRGAKNVIIVGYSLPRTDIYMQYFLKSALGPNTHLNRIFVFDPALYDGNEAGKAMMARYAECFSPQLQDRIHFRPEELGAQHGHFRPGTAAHFVNALAKDPGCMIF